MSKLTGELSYKDWCILKHALEEKVESKEILFELANEDLKRIIRSEHNSRKYEQMKKELEEEKITLERVTKLTNNFKRYIKGKERHYVHRAADCD